jgi:hypothetical protein
MSVEKKRVRILTKPKFYENSSSRNFPFLPDAFPGTQKTGDVFYFAGNPCFS